MSDPFKDAWDPTSGPPPDPQDAEPIAAPAPPQGARGGGYVPGELIALVFMSKTGGVPHIVTLVPYDPPSVICTTCMAILSLRARPGGCWATAKARAILGLPQA